MTEVSFNSGIYRKFSDRLTLANSADPDQTAPSSADPSAVCHSSCNFWSHYSVS